MKTKSIIFALLACFTLGLTSCEDMLSPDNERHAGVDQVAGDTLYGYWGVLKTLQNLGERYVILGEARGDLVATTPYTSDTIAAIADFRNPQDGDCRYLQASDFYAVINNCNAYLAAADTVRPIYGANAGENDRYMMREYAQVWTIRAWTYLQLVQLYDKVPFVTKPLMSTADVEDFYEEYKANAQGTVATRHTLAQLIEDEAGKNLNNIIMQDYPQYGRYNGMVHSMFCFFPTQVVLGDLWLMAAQDKVEYEKAAQYYFDYLNRYQAVLPTSYYCYASENRMSSSRAGRVSYYTSNQSDIFNVSGISPSSPINRFETLTVIPSTTNKLWGTIQRGVNDVFGFTSEVSVSTSATDTTTNASVYLSISAEPQLRASQGFKNLCSLYPYFSQDRTATTEGQEIRYDTIETAVDARIGWSKMLSFYDNGQLQNGEYVMKQNPNTNFSTTYPVVYRKAHVWLRLAEAINRAGFPEYAFAILADGVSKDLTPYIGTTSSDYGVQQYVLTDTLGNTVVGTKAEAYAAYAADTTGREPEDRLYVDAPAVRLAYVNQNDIANLGIDYISKYLTEGVEVRKSATVTTGNTMSIYSGNYIPFNQALTAATKPYLQFTNPSFDVTINSATNHGVHGRGTWGELSPTWCNTMPKDDGTDSVLCKFYNFDLLVKQKWAGYPGRLNYYAVDNGAYADYQANLINAVEELILDEMGMELCFEGNRFNDLVRIAERRNDPSFLAKRVASRTGELNTELEGKLMDKTNWFFKLPNQ